MMRLVLYELSRIGDFIFSCDSSSILRFVTDSLTETGSKIRAELYKNEVKTWRLHKDIKDVNDNDNNDDDDDNKNSNNNNNKKYDNDNNNHNNNKKGNSAMGLDRS